MEPVSKDDGSLLNDILTPKLSDTLHTNKAVSMQKKKRATISAKAKAAIESGDIQAVIDSLTGKQLRFVEEYVLDPNGTQAILKAGYQTKHPNRMAFQLLENPAIRLAIDSLRAERMKQSDVTKDYVLDKIVKALESAETDKQYQAVLRAAELLAKHLGMFVERTEISGPDGDAIQYEKVQEDATAFTSAIVGLANRAKGKT